MDVNAIVQTYHTIDPITGMVESTGNYATPFDAARKTQFLDVYVSSGLQFRNTCKKLGLSHHTVNHHLSIDPEFKSRMKELQEEYAERLEAAQRDFAMDKKCFMDRAMQLRALLPDKYALEKSQSAPQIVINLSSIDENVAKRRDVIEARIAREVETGESASMLENGDNNQPQTHNT